MAQYEREFKGIWISKNVWFDNRLNALDKIILAEIDSLDKSEIGCWASNKYIADFCQCSETKVSTAISKLIELGYLETQSFNGRTRILKVCLSNFESLPFKKCEADFQNLKIINIENNIKDNIIYKENKKESNELNNNIKAEFETLWKKYPRKIGKSKAMKVYVKARKSGTTYEEVEQGISAYCEYIEKQKIETAFVKHGSTWFNNQSWNDSYEPSKPKETKKYGGTYL